MEKTIMGYTAEDIRGQAIAFRCETEELAKDLIEKLYDMGFEWTDNIPPETTLWGEYSDGDETCYRVYSSGRFCTGDYGYYEEKGYKIADYTVETEQRVYKVWELEEDVEYECLDPYFEGTVFWREFNELWFTRDGQEVALTPENTEMSFFEITELEFIEANFNPKLKETYYFPDFKSQYYVGYYDWTNNDTDRQIKRTVGIYRTRKEAFEKAKELGWI